MLLIFLISGRFMNTKVKGTNKMLLNETERQAIDEC